MRSLKNLLLLLLACFALTGAAQVVVEAHLDTASILIGEQVQLRVKCSAGSKQRVQFPDYVPTQELMPGVEVLHNGRIDSLLTNGGKRIELTRRYTITSFDSALYSLPPFEVTVDGKRYASSGKLGLKVSTVAVDTVHVDQFSGPHDVVDMPFRWSWRLMVPVLLNLLLLLSVVALAVRLTDPKLITRRVVIHPPKPAHVTALGRIEEIKRKGAADPKAYYMDLTEALRNYIESRFGFNAKEMTTTEILDRLYETHNGEALDELRSILRTADLVKFAKHTVTMPEQDRSLVQALDYIQTTKSEPKEQPKPRVEYVSLSDKRQNQWRNVMRVAVAVLSLCTVALTAYILYELQCCFGA